jgi:predicted tellurium resistance membrane protein TerC
MGIDNALGIAAAANGNFVLVIAGLLISVPIILFGATMVSRILQRWPDLVFVGSFVLFTVAILMLMKEPLMASWWAVGLAGLMPWAAAILPMVVALVITAVQYSKARLHLRKRYLFKS